MSTATKEALCLEAMNRTGSSIIHRLDQYARDSPGLFLLQVSGGITSLMSLVALPGLGAIGFGATGPVANTVATAWQASIGLVQSGSLFAWCQSATMGGAAVNGIVAGGVSGMAVAVGATVYRLASGISWKQFNLGTFSSKQ